MDRWIFSLHATLVPIQNECHIVRMNKIGELPRDDVDIGVADYFQGFWIRKLNDRVLYNNNCFICMFDNGPVPHFTFQQSIFCPGAFRDIPCCCKDSSDIPVAVVKYCCIIKYS